LNFFDDYALARRLQGRCCAVSTGHSSTRGASDPETVLSFRKRGAARAPSAECGWRTSQPLVELRRSGALTAVAAQGVGVEVCGPAGVWRSGGGCASLRAASAAHQEFTRVRLDGQHTQSAPSPLWGRAGEGGREFWQNCCLISRPRQ
jgi:hypothetical protein